MLLAHGDAVANSQDVFGNLSAVTTTTHPGGKMSSQAAAPWMCYCTASAQIAKDIL